MNNPVFAGPVPVSPETQAALDKTNAQLKADAAFGGKSIIVRANYQEGKQSAHRPVAEGQCPQCFGSFIGFGTVIRCSQCGLEKGIELEKDLRAKRNAAAGVEKEDTAALEAIVREQGEKIAHLESLLSLPAEPLTEDDFISPSPDRPVKRRPGRPKKEPAQVT